MTVMMMPAAATGNSPFDPHQSELAPVVQGTLSGRKRLGERGQHNRQDGLYAML